jgi:hypothetical protein
MSSIVRYVSAWSAARAGSPAMSLSGASHTIHASAKQSVRIQPLG